MKKQSRIENLISKFQNEIGIEMVPFKFMVYIPKYKKYESIDNLDKNLKYKTISGTDLRALLDQGKTIPKWFTYPEISKELRKDE